MKDNLIRRGVALAVASFACEVVELMKMWIGRLYQGFWTEVQGL
jgi:hypothetical protein